MESQIIINIAGILIASVTSYYFSQRRYTFEELHDRKLLYIENIFGRIVSLEKDLKKYVMTTGSMPHERYLEDRIEELKPIQDKFFELQEYFWKKEIIFDQASIDSMENFLNISIEILSKLKASNWAIASGAGETAYDRWNDAYGAMQEKLMEAKKALRENFRETIKR